MSARLAVNIREISLILKPFVCILQKHFSDKPDGLRQNERIIVGWGVHASVSKRYKGVGVSKTSQNSVTYYIDGPLQENNTDESNPRCHQSHFDLGICKLDIARYVRRNHTGKGASRANEILMSEVWVED